LVRASLALILLTSAAPLAAQSIAVSDGPETVSLTVYRASGRGEAPINKNWPQGYALITETRIVQIPAGESLIRFEGVAEGMFPESAIVTGLPKGVREKNRDARLLSPSGLVDAHLKREVMVTRTDKATGKTREQQAVITAGPGGGVILQTAEGYEALHCTGLPERMQYGGVPQNLSAKPTLSVITQSDAPVSAKLTLTYMASGFDWQANYVAQVQDGEGIAENGKNKVDIFAWLTLANGGNQSFANANTMAIAGEPNRERRAEQPRPTGGGLRLQCWPMQRTHEVPYNLGYLPNTPQPIPEAAPAGFIDMVVADDIGRFPDRKSKESLRRVEAAVVAEQEDLGDLKLYRIPEPVTVNAKGQKQVAMIVKPGAAFDRLYTANVDDYYGDAAESLPMTILFRSENRKEKGLGLPMPSGQVMLFEGSNYGPLLAGQSTLSDRAVGDEIEMPIGQSSDVRYRVTQVSQSGKTQRFKVEVSNARNEPVNVEIEIPFGLRGQPKQITKIDGVPTWKATVSANGEATFFYELKLEG
jgi:hypothetical protein